jgi:hypothetical protein
MFPGVSYEIEIPPAKAGGVSYILSSQRDYCRNREREEHCD